MKSESRLYEINFENYSPAQGFGQESGHGH